MGDESRTRAAFTGTALVQTTRTALVATGVYQSQKMSLDGGKKSVLTCSADSNDIPIYLFTIIVPVPLKDRQLFSSRDGPSLDLNVNELQTVEAAQPRRCLVRGVPY